MTVIERRERRDEFPVGMRVLAVDDDPTCLKVLESLLLRCQYHVTTTNQAIKALKMLRENKDQFDLVISDVHMPDMDGFKLLELVGLEMDLPVIMLSANGETQAVMKGITHGACDYLIKPVRIEELKNIWQHVLRRKKFDPRDKNNSDSGEDCDKTPCGNSEGAQGSLVNGSSDNKLNRKRKDQNEEYEEDDDNLNENDDPSGQKKPRVVWTVELHRKFVSAVNQLGLDKAVPKRIFDLMNVERLTRENVASHLQKYRLYLKRLSAVTNQQVNMAAILRSRDPSYLSMGLDGYSNFNSLVGSRLPPGRSSTSSTTTFQSNGSIPRMNSFNGFGLHGFVPPRSLNNTSNPVNGIAKLSSLQNNHRQGTLIQGMPTSLELDRLQQPKAIHETNNHSFNNFSGSGIVGISHSSNSFANATKSSHILQPNHQRTQPTGSSNQSSVRIPTLSSDPFEGGIGTMSLPFNDLSSSPNDSRLGSNARGISCSNVVPNAQNQASTLITTSVIGDANSSSFECLGNSNFNWEAPKQGQLQDPCLMFSSLSDSSVPNIHINDQNLCDQRLGTGFSNRKMDGSSLQGGFGSSGSGSGSGLADIVGNAMIKPECDDIDFMDGDLGCSDLYDISLGACI